MSGPMGRPGGGMGPGSGRPRPGSGPGSGPPHMAMMMPTEKASNFRASFVRLMRELGPERLLVASVFALGVVSVFLVIIGPKILGEATNVIFEGVVGMQLGRIPGVENLSIDQIVAGMRAQGQTNMADMLASMPNVVPGQGIDFGRLAPILGIVAGIYVGQLAVQLGPELHHGRRHPAHRLPAPRPRRSQAWPPAARLLRP